jgi:MFS family permease
VLAGASVAQAAVSLVNFGLPAIGPELLTDYDLTLFELGAVLSAGLLGAGVALIGAGVLVDRIGARRSMLSGTALGTVGLALAAAADSKHLLFWALVVFGVGSAVVPIAGTGALFRAYPPARRGWAIGVRQTAVPVGGAIAAVAYPALYALGGTGLTLALSAAAVAVSGLWFALGLPAEEPHVVRRRGRALGEILRAPGLTTLLAVAACYIVVLQALLAYLVPAVRESGHSELTATVAYFGVNVAAIVARIVWGSVADRGGGARRVRTLVEVGIVAAIGALVFALALHGGAFAVVLAAMVFGLGALGWNALIYVSAGERVDPSLAGRSVAVAATVVFVLSGVATPLLGALVDALGWDVLWVATGVTAGAGAYLAHRLPPQTVARAS